MSNENKDLPKISIVTPSFNDAAFLEQTIRSVVSQGYPNLEYIVIDGGSTDGSVEIIKKYEDQISFWVSEKDKGMYDAIQKGFTRCTGEVMGWINSDDILHTRSLFTIAEVFSRFNEINWLQGFPNVIDEQGRIVSTMPLQELNKLYFYSKFRSVSRYFQQESMYWRRSLWEKAGGFVSSEYKYASDFELWTRFFQFEQLYTINACLAAFRVSKSGQASVEHFGDYVKETDAILQKYPLSKLEQKQLKSMERFESLQRLTMRWFDSLKRSIKLIDNSVVREKIYFDGTTQTFKMK